MKKKDSGRGAGYVFKPLSGLTGRLRILLLVYTNVTSSTKWTGVSGRVLYTSECTHTHAIKYKHMKINTHTQTFFLLGSESVTNPL